MSEHAWVLESIPSYSAGGLETEERERLERHTAECQACAQALAETRAFDRTIDGLFASVRPGVALEERLVQGLRTPPRRRGVVGRVLLAAAAVLLVAILGWQVSELEQTGHLLLADLDLSFGREILARTGVLSRDDSAVNAVDRSDGNAPKASADDLARQLRVKATQEPQSDRPPGTSGSTQFSQIVSARKDKQDGSLNNGSLTPEFAYDILHQSTSAHNSSRSGDGLRSKLGGGGSSVGNKSEAEPLIQGQLIGGNVRTQSSRQEEPEPALTASNSPPAINYFKPIDLASSAFAPPGQDETKANEAEKLAENLQRKLTERDAVNVIRAKGIDPKVIQDAIDALQGRRPTEPGDRGRVETQTIPGTDTIAGRPSKGKPEASPAATRKIVIRSGEIEFEIQSFDGAVAAVTRLVADIKGGYVDTVNSEKLPNGKVRGAVVVRVPPEALDNLLLDLRKELGKAGELKNLRVGSQDITKQYTDLESRLRAARTMEERLLQIIKTGKGEIKDLLQAEKELGVWRTKIEEIEGELRYYGNLVSLSTLTITLYEKEILAPFAVVETERVQMGIEVEDVDKALQQGVAAVTQAKGRITKSELKQHEAGQYTALLHFEVAPEAAGPLRDRLRQLGNVARLDIDRVQQTEGGPGKTQNARSKRSDTQFMLSLYNVANVAPRESVQINLASPDVETAYRTILALANKSTGRVIRSNLNRLRNDQTTATVQFEVKTAEADTVLKELKEVGQVIRLQSTENPDAANVTRSKRGFNVELLALGLVAPRETAELLIATQDVPAGYRTIQAALAKVKGRILTAQLNEQNKQNITAQIEFDILRSDQAGMDETLAKAGDTLTRNVTRNQDGHNLLDSLVRHKISLINLARIPPRESLVLGIEVPSVDSTAAAFAGLVHESQGRVIESNVAHERNGRVTAKLVYDVPLTSASSLAERFRNAGVVRVQQAARNAQVPEGPLATARLDVTLSNADLIVPSDDGLWMQIRKGLSTSFVALSWSLMVVVVGVCFVLPWALIGYFAYRIVVRLKRPAGDARTPA